MGDSNPRTVARVASLFDPKSRAFARLQLLLGAVRVAPRLPNRFCSLSASVTELVNGYLRFKIKYSPKRHLPNFDFRRPQTASNHREVQT